MLLSTYDSFDQPGPTFSSVMILSSFTVKFPLLSLSAHLNPDCRMDHKRYISIHTEWCFVFCLNIMFFSKEISAESSERTTVLLSKIWVWLSLDSLLVFFWFIVFVNNRKLDCYPSPGKTNLQNLEWGWL